MSKKIDERIPRFAGEKVLPSYPAVKSPWERLISYHDAAHYCQRYTAVVSAGIMQAFRILVPDYEERSKAICKNAYNRLYYIMGLPGVADSQMEMLCIHPFMAGQFTGGFTGDRGDDELLMCGRVRDCGTYRVEKELDVCYWDIVGSELCRSTTQSLQACADRFAQQRHEGPPMEYHMVEAKGCGDLHCRIVAESREKYPMPEHEQWECFGPVATADQIKFTEEEYMVKESMVFREECENRFINGTCCERDTNTPYPMVATSNGATYILPTLDDLIRSGRLDDAAVNHVLKCVFEAAGKAAFGEVFAKEGLRSWMGAPNDVDDGRLLGGYIEMFLQCMRHPYEIEAFNRDEVIYVIDRSSLANHLAKLPDCYVSYWYGMAKTLVGSMWALWEEPGDTAPDKLRIKIAKKIDKFC